MRFWKVRIFQVFKNNFFPSLEYIYYKIFFKFILRQYKLLILLFRLHGTVWICKNFVLYSSILYSSLESTFFRAIWSVYRDRLVYAIHEVPVGNFLFKFQNKNTTVMPMDTVLVTLLPTRNRYLLSPSKHWPVQSQQQKHHKKVWNLFKTNNKDTRTTSELIVKILNGWKLFTIFEKSSDLVLVSLLFSLNIFYNFF